MSERPPIPTDERKPAWRLACLAYRDKRRAGASDHEAHEAAVAAVQSVLPLSWKEASAEAVNIDVRWGENEIERERRYAVELVARR